MLRNYLYITDIFFIFNKLNLGSFDKVKGRNFLLREIKGLCILNRPFCFMHKDKNPIFQRFL